MFVCKLVVHVVEAKDILPPKQNSSSTSLYATVEVGSSKKKTKIIKNSLEPRWDQSFEFEIEESNFPFVHISLHDKGVFGSTTMGKVSIKSSTKNLSTVEFFEDWYPLLATKSGKNSSGALKIRLQTVKTKPSLKKKSTRALIESDKSILKCVRNSDYEELVELLGIVSAEEVNKPEEKTGNTPLHIACLESKTIDERILSSLLEFDGIKVDVQNTDLNTPLHYFCAKWQSPDLGYLHSMIKRGADVNAVNSNAETPIFKAIWNESIRSLLMETLIENGANVDSVNSFGEGILHYAVRFGRSDLVNLILNSVSRLDIKGKDGKTPYELAIQYKYANIAKHLKKVEELFVWLEDYGFEKYKSNFLKNEIYKNLLPDITSDLLNSMDIPESDWPRILESCRKLETRENYETIELEGDELNDDKAEQFKANLLPNLDGDEWVINGKEIEYLKRLGSGTSGDVYKGLYRDKYIAIKVLKEMTEEKEQDEFKKEFRVLCAMDHPNIVKFYGASFRPKLCMVMEFCARGSLYHVLKDETLEIGWTRALNIMLETTLGLEALHNNKPQILHRDFKSLNLLVTDDWQIKVADFGLSRFDTVEALETLKQMRGTFAYCAPESYFGAKYTTKSDVYSLGIIFIEIIIRTMTGKYSQPYSEYKNITFDFQIIIQAAKDKLRPTLPSDTPEILVKLVQQCVHEENETRPTCLDVIETLKEAIEHYSSKGSW